jgi:hypothetical protein
MGENPPPGKKQITNGGGAQGASLHGFSIQKPKYLYHSSTFFFFLFLLPLLGAHWTRMVEPLSGLVRKGGRGTSGGWVRNLGPEGQN